MSDAREPAANNPDGEHPASGRRNEPVSDGHVDLEAVAELDEGLQVDRADSIRAHLAACPHCQQRAADLTEVRRVLAAAAPATMPDDVAARIDAAINAAADAGDRRVVPLRRPWYQRRPLQVGLAAAATAVVAVGGVATTRALLPGDKPVVSADSSEEGAAGRGTEEGRGHPPAAAPLSKGAAGGLDVIATATRYSAGTVDEQVSELVRRRMVQSSPDVAASPGVAGAPEALRPLTDADRLGRCVASATADADRRPLVVDLAYYEGQPAAVIVLPARAQGQLDVWVVGRACSADNPDVLQHTQVPF